MRLYIKLLVHNRCSNYSEICLTMYFTPTMSQKKQGWVRHISCPPSLTDSHLWTLVWEMCWDTKLWRLSSQGSQWKIFEREPDQTWKLTCSFLVFKPCEIWKSSSRWRKPVHRTFPQDSVWPSVILVTPQQVTISSPGATVVRWLVLKLFPFQDSYTSPSPLQVFRAVKNSWLNLNSTEFFLILRFLLSTCLLNQ